MKTKAKIQPRIPGVTRENKGSGLLTEVEAGIKAIAKDEGWSESRVRAHIISDWFDIDSDTGKLLSDKRIVKSGTEARWREPLPVDAELARAQRVLKQYGGRTQPRKATVVPMLRTRKAGSR